MMLITAMILQMQARKTMMVINQMLKSFIETNLFPKVLFYYPKSSVTICSHGYKLPRNSRCMQLFVGNKYDCHEKTDGRHNNKQYILPKLTGLNHPKPVGQTINQFCYKIHRSVDDFVVESAIQS